MLSKMQNCLVILIALARAVDGHRAPESSAQTPLLPQFTSLREQQQAVVVKSHGYIEVGASTSGTKTNVTARARGIDLKVATLNSLAIWATSRKPSSFPTVSDRTIDLKKQGWLAEVALKKALDSKVDIIAVQEVDYGLQHKEYNCSIKWQKTEDSDPQYLCFNPITVSLIGGNGGERCGQSFYGTTTCQFQKDGAQIKVMAAHGSPSFSEIKNIAEFAAGFDADKPDLVLMDANEVGSEAQQAAGNEYTVFPSSDAVTTTMKTEFKYRKLYQGATNPPGLAAFPLTCAEVMQQKKCGDMTSAASESTAKGCKYVSRICGTYDQKTQREVAAMEQELGMQKVDLKLDELATTLDRLAGDIQNTRTVEKQEDVILGKVARVGIYPGTATEIYPGTEDLAFRNQGDIEGYPNEVWPSDHFLVMAKFQIDQ